MNSNHGQVTIAPDVLVTISRLTTESVAGVAQMCHQVGPCYVDRLFRRVVGGRGVRVAVVDDAVRVDLCILVEPDVDMRRVSTDIQKAVARAIQDMVGMRVEAVHVHIRDVAYSRRND